MADTASVFSKAGGGHTFEHYIQTAFLTTMITNGSVPSIIDSRIDEIGFQSTRIGYQTDDLFVRCTSPHGEHRLVAQIKHEFSFTRKDSTFKGIIAQLWADFTNSDLFNQDSDNLLIVKENLNKSEANNVKTLINWAKSKSTPNDFLLEVSRLKNKQETLDIFRDVIESNVSTKISDKTLWLFFRCLVLLSYDFGNHDSTHKAYYINLIRLARTSSSTVTENEIWSQLYEYVTILNKDGGLININSLAKQAFYSHFKSENLSPYYSSIDKLNKDSALILNQLSNEIHGFHLDRFSLKQKIVESINNRRITIITGNPGVGKSAIINDVLEDQYHSSAKIVLRADQLNEPHLSKALSNLGISHPIEDVLSCMSISPQKIIFIDSLEKLLEGDSENAFKQLYNALTDYPDIKIVAASRKYALDLIYFKYGIKNITQIEIPPLSKEEIALIVKEFPQLNAVISNHAIYQLLKNPKYIDFALTLVLKDKSDHSNISVTDFKHRLWNHVVEDITYRHQGLPRKRSNAFIKIAVDRAKGMCLFIEPNDVDPIAVEALENDNIIYREGENYKFSPSHDILEDWALIRYVASKKHEAQSVKTFYQNLGNEPAIRRAFRLWIEDSLIDDQESIFHLIRSTTNDDTVDEYWADEILIAVFKSGSSNVFTHHFYKVFVENEFEFLRRCIHLIRTACKERSVVDSQILIPMGSGWEAILKLLSEKKTELDNHRLLIINLLSEWEYKLIFSIQNPTESESVFDILVHYLNQIQSQDEFWFSYSDKDKYNKILLILFNLIPISKKFTIELIDKALSFERNDSNWRLKEFHENVLEICLSGIHCKKAAKEFPTKICEVAWSSWKYEEPKIKPPFYQHSAIDTNVHYGLREYLKDSPPGIYKTPFYSMLFSNTDIALDFIIDFTNHCCESYSKSELSQQNDITEISIALDEKKTIKQIGSFVLWQAYRGTGTVVPDVLRSILISLEKYLLFIAGIKTERSKELVQKYFYHLLENSNNVAITSVLNSICLAYPGELERCLLNIVGIKEAYEWDSSRALNEHTALSPMDFEYSFAQKEMHYHNKLEHRTKFQRGLYDFVVYYQFNIRTLNKEIHLVFDSLKENTTEEDINWRKILFEIDIRNWEVEDYDKAKGGFIVQPKYQDDIKDYVDTNEPEFTKQNLAASYSLWISKKFRNEDNVPGDFENWQSAYQYLNQKETYDPLYDKPGSLAHVGLRDYRTNLSDEQKTWCVEYLIESLTKIYTSSLDRGIHSTLGMNPREKEPCLSSFSLVLHEVQSNTEDKDQLAILLLYCLISSLPKYEKLYLIEDFRDRIWDVDERFAHDIWTLLIRFSLYKNDNHYFLDDPDKDKVKQTRAKELEFINGNLGNEAPLDLVKLDFNSCIGHYLLLAVSLMPYSSSDKKFSEFLDHLINTFFTALSTLDRTHDSLDKIRISHEDKTELMKYLSKYLIIQSPETAGPILTNMLRNYYSLDDSPGKTSGIYEFIRTALEFTISELDFIAARKNQYKSLTIENAIEHFWILWDVLYEQINKSDKLDFSSTLFLDINSNGVTWDEDFKDWLPLEGKETYYKNLVLDKGQENITAILDIFVSIGHTRLLPEGINWLVDVIKANPSCLGGLINSKGDRLIENVFHHYCNQIKSNKTLLDNYLWLLNRMIDAGSSIAYLIRENVITYKSSYLLT